jgi:hypothetical protein
VKSDGGANPTTRYARRRRRPWRRNWIEWARVLDGQLRVSIGTVWSWQTDRSNLQVRRNQPGSNVEDEDQVDRSQAGSKQPAPTHGFSTPEFEAVVRRATELQRGRTILAWGPVERAVLRRSITLWILVRGTFGMLLALGGADPLLLDVRATFLLIGAVGTISWLDTTRRNEDLLLANLGLATVGALVSAMAVNSRARDLLGPLILLPLVVPVMIAAAASAEPLLAATGPSYEGLGRWIGVLALYDVIFLLVGYAVYDYLLED